MRGTARARVFSILAAAVLLALGAMTASADQRDFTLINGSAITITNAYVEKSDLNTWGEDVLGLDVLPPGESIDITFSGYDADECLFDIKVIGRNGEEGYLYKVDLCVISRVTFS
ncbi:MAG: hypothetical protein HW416_1339 [Chloroflexi bacterium]|nr:hypothetical protein [Chloroflexota bacterium]